MTLYVLDLAGTLTPARLPMAIEFAIHFYKWQKTSVPICRGWSVRRFFVRTSLANKRIQY
jgi:hypothetical protein